VNLPPHRPLLPELLPADDVQALFFDCDGTLVDTLPAYQEAWTGPLAQHGFEMTDEWFHSVAGLPAIPFLQAALGDASPEVIAQVEQEGFDSFLAHVHLIDLVDHVVDVAKVYQGRLPLAVVSGGKRDIVVRTLEAVGIADLFDTIVTADDVPTSKPAPDSYLLAVQRLGVDPARCLAYEDSSTGIDSARAAGIPVIDVRGLG
jgi:beta-phosphoglucomutase-like phosphatase (HAD superfamily)